MQLIETAINTAKLGGVLSIEVLTSLAEETVLRSKAHQWEVSCKDIILRLMTSKEMPQNIVVNSRHLLVLLLNPSRCDLVFSATICSLVQVVEAMQGSSSNVLKYLWHFVSSTADPASVAKAFLCLDR
jgi:hypothetical protein